MNKHTVREENTPDSTTTSIAVGTPQRIETETHVIYTQPRISAAKLAEFIIADSSRKETITRQSKRASKAIMAHYRRVRSSLKHALTSDGLSAESLRTRATEIAGMPALTTWQKEDNRRSARALNLLAEMSSQIAFSHASVISRPEGGWPHLMICGVRVSIQPELVVSIPHRNVTKTGAVILNTGEGESLSLARKAGDYCVGDYLTVLLHLMLGIQPTIVGAPLHTKCHAVDIHRQMLYTTPQSYRTMIKHIESSCRMIVLLWNSEAMAYELEEGEANSEM